MLGLAWRGNPAGVGGTCQQRARYNVDNRTYRLPTRHLIQFCTIWFVWLYMSLLNILIASL